MTTPLLDAKEAQGRINSLRAALNQIAYSRSTETPGQFVEALQKMARDALINYRNAFSEWRSAVYISKADADDWLRSRSAIIEALEKAGLCLWSNAGGFWIAPAPALPVAWQQTSADGEPLWDENTFSSTPNQFDYSRPLYANPVQTTPAPADDVPKIYYMRDNHTFQPLTGTVEQMLDQCRYEFDEGHKYGMLCSKREGFANVNASGRWAEFEEAARRALDGARPPVQATPAPAD